ncbi:hypothetical protein [Lactobacillus gallinarum]|uniref:hypothetical protein n=1 Tax=Lactobacillus gallinarum TaxID=52242 RepID=UPI000B39BDD0|nr:hypothetical protein [Lactobacillus gallinarum]OUQ00227.1 hypothetical protein B5E95_06655 [Lactobacillus gallinarum]
MNYETNFVDKRNIKNTFLLSLLFALLLIAQSVDNGLRDNGYQGFSKIKFSIMGIVFCVFFIQYICSKNKTDYLLFELKDVFYWYLCLILISIYWMIKNNTWNSAPFIIGFSRIMFPIIFAYLISNSISKEQIYKVFEYFLVISFLIFLVDEIRAGHFNFSEIFTLSLSNSTGSEMESNYFSPTAMSLCLFFGYFRKKKWPLILSIIYVLLTYKRLMFFYSILIMVVSFTWRNKKIKSWIKYIAGILFFVLVVYFIQLNIGIKSSTFVYNLFGMNLNDFTMGRTWMFQNIYKAVFPKMGLFSIINVPFQNPEMDLPIMYLEMGYIAIVATILFLLKLSKNSLYNFLIIIFILLEMLTSHWLDITFFWIVVYITIGYINEDNKQ